MIALSMTAVLASINTRQLHSTYLAGQTMSVSHEPFPIIIYGAPRSGTTYLNSILNQHPEVFITHETRLFVWAHRALTVLPNVDKAVLSYRRQFVEHLYKSFPQLITDFYRSIKKRGARYWGDKNPHYADSGDIGCLETIDTLFPGTRFIHIIRDGRDVVTSLLRKKWVDFNTAHRMWPRFVDRGCDFGRQLPQTQYFELRYEDLTMDDLTVTQSIFDFLRIPIHQSVLDYCQSQRTSRLPLSEATRDLSSGVSVSDWSTFLTADEQRRSLDLLGRHLIKYGYETEASLEGAYGPYGPLIRRVQEAVSSVVPVGATVLIISKGDDDLLKLDRRTGWHFPQTDNGEYAGYYPADSLEALSHLECLQRKGAQYLVIPWPSAWWLEHYSQFSDHLAKTSRRILTRDDTCVIYELGVTQHCRSAGASMNGSATDTGRAIVGEDAL